jgi:uncharacterized protein (TIGR00251 family)
MVEVVILVKPGSSKNEIYMNPNNELVVRLRAKPIDGAANTALVEFLSSQLNIRKSGIEILKGTTSRVKKLQLVISQTEWDQRKQTIGLKK